MYVHRNRRGDERAERCLSSAPATSAADQREATAARSTQDRQRNVHPGYLRGALPRLIPDREPNVGHSICFLAGTWTDWAQIVAAVFAVIAAIAVLSRPTAAGHPSSSKKRARRATAT